MVTCTHAHGPHCFLIPSELFTMYLMFFEFVLILQLQSLVEDNRNPSNQTTDWQEFFSQAIDLVEVLRTAQNTSVFELARDLLEILDNLDLYELNPWLDFLLDGSMGGLLGNGTLGGNR